MMSRLVSSIVLSTTRLGPNRTRSMSRYSSTAASSSRSVTKCSWLRSSRRSSPDSLTMSSARGLRLRSDERRDRRERVEQEVRVDLIGERLDARRHQQLLLLGEPVLDARAVPDLDRNGDGEHRRQQDENRVSQTIGRREAAKMACRELGWPIAWRSSSSRTGAVTRITCQSSVSCADEPPRRPVELGDEERREPPDLLLRTDLAQAAAGEAAADGERAARRTRQRTAAGMPTAAPTSAPAYGPAMRPARNAPDSVRSAAVVVEERAARRRRR